MTLFQNKYRVEPARLTDYDYSTPGWYFITICTKNRLQYFGDIVSVETPDPGVSKTAIENQPHDPGIPETPTAKIRLSKIGQIADKYWNEIHSHFPHVILHEYQIMPDHIHGIIQITAVETPDPGVSNTTETPDPGVYTLEKETPESGVSTHPTIGIMINQFKRICTIKTRNANLKFAWQPRFHDHIIRDDEELQRIRKYIRDNPQNWWNNKL